MVLMIGLSLIKVGIIDFGGGFSAMSSGTFGKYEHIGLGLLVLCVIVAFNCSRSPLLRMSGIAIGLMVGYAVALMLGMVDFPPLRTCRLLRCRSRSSTVSPSTFTPLCWRAPSIC